MDQIRKCTGNSVPRAFQQNTNRDEDSKEDNSDQNLRGGLSAGRGGGGDRARDQEENTGDIRRETEKR
jgi:hypothetical protein